MIYQFAHSDIHTVYRLSKLSWKHAFCWQCSLHSAMERIWGKEKVSINIQCIYRNIKSIYIIPVINHFCKLSWMVLCFLPLLCIWVDTAVMISWKIVSFQFLDESYQISHLAALFEWRFYSCTTPEILWLYWTVFCLWRCFITLPRFFALPVI